MTTKYAVRTDEGITFEDGDDRGRILVFGHETGGQYGLMEYRVASRAANAAAEAETFSPHRHNTIEETFLVRRGNLRFLLGTEVIELAAGDFVRVPPGVRHGYANVSGQDVDLLISFHPGGFEELFLKYRSDQHPAPAPDGFVADATAHFASEFEAAP
jgi:mannose-6-phosphate isomerase-like protein (cupin superfamily)